MEEILPTLIVWFVTMFLMYALITYVSHGELWRPMIGQILRKKPMIPKDHEIDSMDLFRVANNGKLCDSHAELMNSFRMLTRVISLRSYFRTTDQERLRRHLIDAHHQLAMKMKRAQDRQRQQQQKAKSKPPPTVVGWRKILGVSPTEKDPKVIKTAYRKLVAKDHPDHGGSGKNMPDLNKAIAAARKELNFV